MNHGAFMRCQLLHVLSHNVIYEYNINRARYNVKCILINPLYKRDACHFIEICSFYGADLFNIWLCKITRDVSFISYKMMNGFAESHTSYY